jgi:8-oxo-dGTP pyrophosphatase MutT (NUDIX family)
MRELLEETGLALKAGAEMVVLPEKPTDNGDIAHGFMVNARDTFGELKPSKEGVPAWLKPEDLVRDRAGHPPVRFPKYNEWALRTLGMSVKK